MMLNYYLNPFTSQNDLWDDFFTPVRFNDMLTDIKETEDEYLFDVELPGFKKEDIKLSIKEGYLTINAEKKQEIENQDNLIRKERRYGTISRSYYVGDVNQNDVSAKFEDGILKIVLKKQEQKVNYIDIN